MKFQPNQELLSKVVCIEFALFSNNYFDKICEWIYHILKNKKSLAPSLKKIKFSHAYDGSITYFYRKSKGLVKIVKKLR